MSYLNAYKSRVGQPKEPEKTEPKSPEIVSPRPTREPDVTEQKARESILASNPAVWDAIAAQRVLDQGVFANSIDAIVINGLPAKSHGTLLSRAKNGLKSGGKLFLTRSVEGGLASLLEMNGFHRVKSDNQEGYVAYSL